MITALSFVPIVLSTLVLAAHFLRAGQLVLVLATLSLLLFLMVPRRWAAWVVQAGLWAGTLVWIETTVRFTMERMAAGEPYLRMVTILGAVALVTALSSLLLFTRRMRAIYPP
jgi:hypothetical protein